MNILAYIRTTWNDGASPPISAANLNKIELGLVGSLPLDGVSWMTGQLKTIIGTPTAVAVGPSIGASTGIIFTGSTTIGLSTVGVERVRITAGGSVGIGTASPTTILQVAGTVTATTFSGPLSGNATTATNLALGGQGQIPYQSNTNTTAFVTAGISKQVLMSNGTFAPMWTE